jgi:hypothetical protein
MLTTPKKPAAKAEPKAVSDTASFKKVPMGFSPDEVNIFIHKLKKENIELLAENEKLSANTDVDSIFRIGQLETQLQEVSWKFKDATEKIKGFEKVASEAEARVKKADKRVADAEAKVADAEARIAQAETSSLEFHAPDTETQKRAEEAEKDAAVAKKRVAEIEKSLAEAKKRIADAEKISKEAEKRIAKANEMYTKEKELTSILTEECGRLGEDIEKIKADYEAKLKAALEGKSAPAAATTAPAPKPVPKPVPAPAPVKAVQQPVEKPAAKAPAPVPASAPAPAPKAKKAPEKSFTEEKITKAAPAQIDDADLDFAEFQIPTVSFDLEPAADTPIFEEAVEDSKAAEPANTKRAELKIQIFQEEAEDSYIIPDRYLKMMEDAESQDDDDDFSYLLSDINPADDIMTANDADDDMDSFMVGPAPTPAAKPKAEIPRRRTEAPAPVKKKSDTPVKTAPAPQSAPKQSPAAQQSPPKRPAAAPGQGKPLIKADGTQEDARFVKELNDNFNKPEPKGKDMVAKNPAHKEAGDNLVAKIPNQWDKGDDLDDDLLSLMVGGSDGALVFNNDD